MSEQTTCGKDAMFRYTWPGRDESYICAEHAQKLRGVAQAIGLHVQLISLPELDDMGTHIECAQKESHADR